MEVGLILEPTRPAGTAAFPADAPAAGAGESVLRLGCCTAPVRAQAGAPAGQVSLAPDVWERLAVPYDGIRLRLRETAPGQLELGPAVAVLYYGRPATLPPAKAADRARLYYGHLSGAAGLLAFGFEETIDWDAGTMDGYVLDNRPACTEPVVSARFPIPAAIRLAWSIDRQVIQQLRERTENRTFNWVRNIGKWQFYSLLAGVSGVGEHLPATRLFQGPADLAAMLVRYGTVFVKHTFSVRGRAVAWVRRTADGLEVRHMDGPRLVETRHRDLDQLVPYLREALGPGRCIVQQGIPITGVQGRAMDFRVVLVRDGATGWRRCHTHARVAPDQRLVITNQANGATEEDLLDTLAQHHGLTGGRARECADRMVDLSLAAARVLAGPFHPLGILGFDVALEAGTGRLWLLEVNSVPGWDYPAHVELDLARSQADYALCLTGFAPPFAPPG